MSSLDYFLYLGTRWVPVDKFFYPRSTRGYNFISIPIPADKISYPYPHLSGRVPAPAGKIAIPILVVGGEAGEEVCFFLMYSIFYTQQSSG